MDWDRRRASSVLLVATCLALGSVALACAPIVLEPASTMVERKNIVRITVGKVSRDVLEFQIENLSKEPIVVMKGEIVVETYFGTMRHPPGSKAPNVEIAPGAKETIALRFTAKGLERGDEFLVHFDDAIRLKGQPVALDPVIYYVARSRV